MTYVGKDIANHLWKFGLLPRDFYYQPFYKHPDGHEVWTTTSEHRQMSQATRRSGMRMKFTT